MSFRNAISATAAKVDSTARYTIDAILVNADKPPVLVMKHAGDKNRAYRNAVFKLANARRNRSGGAITEASVAADRELEAKMFAQYVVTAWENVCEEPGKPAPCTPEKVEEFLLAIADERSDIFLALVAFARDQDNFRDGDAGDLGKP